MDYADIFDAPPLVPMLVSMLQAAPLFALVLLGLKLVGRRVFGEQGPQDLVILVLIAEACNAGISHEEAGYWGSAVSVVTILVLGWLCEKLTYIRRLLEGQPVLLYKDGIVDRKLMKKHMVDESDLEMTAREHGLASYRDFSAMMLEGDGKLSGIIKRDADTD